FRKRCRANSACRWPAAVDNGPFITHLHRRVSMASHAVPPTRKPYGCAHMLRVGLACRHPYRVQHLPQVCSRTMNLYQNTSRCYLLPEGCLTPTVLLTGK
ncbi:unnamed protein product, partial [Ectocarpus sp. 8 AP-2014]